MTTEYCPDCGERPRSCAACDGAGRTEECQPMMSFSAARSVARKRRFRHRLGDNWVFGSWNASMNMWMGHERLTYPQILTCMRDHDVSVIAGLTGLSAVVVAQRLGSQDPSWYKHLDDPNA